MAAEQNQGIFQQKALDRLRSPEQLDKLVSVTNPVGWVALVAILLLIISGMIWAVFGVMAIKVDGTGMIVKSSGVASIAHVTGGKVEKLEVSVGTRVHKGQVVARLAQPSTDQEIARLKEEMGATTSRTELALKVAQVNESTDKRSSDGLVISPYDGIVTEKKVKNGEIIQSGTALFEVRLGQDSEDMMAVIYVPVLEGKKVQPGMVVQIAPGSVDSSEYGSLVGIVSSISDQPVGAESVSAWMGNKEMTNWIMQRNNGAVMEVRVRLIKDSDTVSGYLWTSIMGSPEVITPGTTCTGSVIVQKQAPVSKAFRKINQWLRSD